MIFIFYQIVTLFIILISPILILVRLVKKKEHKKRFKEKFCFFSKKRVTGKLIWFHGSSVGEIMSIVPLIQYYENNSNINQILITSSTLSSSKILEKYKFKKTVHQFFPIDFIFFSRKFLKFWKPDVSIFVESEIWPSMFYSINNFRVPLILLNGRLTKKTFDKWTMLANFSKSVFSNITFCFPQNYESFNYFKRFKVKKNKFIGNLKFIENPQDEKNLYFKKLKKKFYNRKLWIAASTHGNEEFLCAKAHLLIKKKFKNLTTIIIPRHIHRIKDIIFKIQKLNLTITTHSDNLNETSNNSDIYLVDVYGESKNFYKIANTVFLGGSFANHGGQNPLEAARYGAKILHGPNTQNFSDVYKFLNKIKISKKVKNYNELASLVSFKKTKNNKIEIKKIGKKIFQRTSKEIDNIIFHAS